VITIYGGTTVEVLNTDAEGRLVMADALARSADDHPDLLVDVATLTGAQLVALGPRIAGVMANSDEVREGVVDAARRAGEQAWGMPLPEELRKGLDSPVADLANVTGERHGGMLVAGLFLKEFVPGGVRWAHMDIAGPAFHEGEPYGYTPKGGTGAAVRTLVQLAFDVAEGRL
jgi:leucyl aminopeptidase